MHVIKKRPLKTKRMLMMESQHGKKLERLLPDTYNRLGDWKLVARELGVSRFTLWTWRRFMGIESRRMASVKEQSA